jgi:hypothetical protein
LFGFSYFLYFLHAVELASVYAGALLRRLAPGTRPGQVTRPERPGPALARTNGIDDTSSFFAGSLQEYAIFRSSLFNDRCAQPDALKILLPQLLNGCSQEISDQLNLRLCNPDITPRGSRAAPAALDTLKVQTTSIPQIAVQFFGHGIDSLSIEVYEFKALEIASLMPSLGA